MKTLKRAIGLAFLLSLTLAACSTKPPVTAQAEKPEPLEGLAAEDVPDPALEAYEKSLQQAGGLVQNGELDKALAHLKERLAVPQFRRLPPFKQYIWLHLSGLLAMQLNDADFAHATSVQSTTMPSAREEDWLVRFYSAAAKDYRQDAVDSLTMIARNWPDALSNYDDHYLASFVGKVVGSAQPQGAQPLLEALFDAKWKMSGGLEPSYFWLHLARMRVEQNEPQRAAEVAARITSARALLAMRVDKRFEPLVAADPKRFDVSAAVDREIESLQKLSAASPRILMLKAEQMVALVEAGRYTRAIALADEVLASSATPEAAAEHYDDADDQFAWILDYRAEALLGLGKWDEAERFLKTAAARPERGRPNVSNSINLAYLYASLGRSGEAMAALGGLAAGPDEASPYGKMQVQLVLLRAALGRKDAPAARVALDDLRQSQSTSPETFQAALLDANELDEAAGLLISRLKDPQQRSAALVDVQDYKMVVPTPANRLAYERWRVLRARKDVQAAVAAVGRIEQFPLPPGLR